MKCNFFPEQVVEILKKWAHPHSSDTPRIFVCIEDLGRHAKYRMSLDLKISVLFVCKGGHVSCLDMQNYIHKCKNDNLFSDQVFVLLMFIIGGESEVAKLLSWCAFKRVK